MGRAGIDDSGLRRAAPACRAAVIAGLLAAVAPAALARAEAATDLPQPLVRLAEIDATIIQDMRYAGPDNFTGGPVPGYAAGVCILVRTAAEALARVQADLLRRGLSLKVYDCYRPERAVRAFADWVESAPPLPATQRFHPRIDRRRLHELRYIARRSGHARGAAVDVTLVALPARAVSEFDPARRYGPCIAPPAERAPDNSVDMGTGYDCFDPLSHADAAGLTGEQRRRRQFLRQAMQAHGFAAYHREWWHFVHTASDDGEGFDVPVTAGR